MRLFIHAGLNKTGSSSLQSYLHHVRQSLEETGVIYPDLGARAHWRVAADLMNQGGEDQDLRQRAKTGYLDRLAERDGVGDALKTLAALIREHRDSDRVMLISQENFSTQGTMRRLLAFLREADPSLQPTVLAYCREPASLFQSSLQHNIKAGKEYHHPAAWKSTHHIRVKGMRRLCGDQLRLRCFSSKVMKDRDVVADFIDWFRLEAGLTLPAAGRTFEMNNALSAQGCALLVEAQEDAASPLRDIPNLRKKLLGYDGPFATRAKLSLPSDWQNLIRQRLGPEWNAIVDTMEYPSEVKAQVKIVEEPVDVSLAPDAVTRWLLGHVTPEYREGFLAHVADRSRNGEAGRRRGKARVSTPLPDTLRA